MKITIRPATEEDYDILNELRRQVNDLHVQGRPDIFRPGFGEELQRHLLNYFVRPRPITCPGISTMWRKSAWTRPFSARAWPGCFWPI